MALIALLIVIAYQIDIADSNAYMGYQSIVLTYSNFLIFILGFFSTAFLTPKEVRLPSDFFRFFYIMFVIFPYLVLYGISGDNDLIIVLKNILILSVPLYLITIIIIFSRPMKIAGVLNEKTLHLTLIFLSIATLVFSLINAPSSAGFGIVDSYDRRIEGREVFQDGSISAYLSSMIINGILPFLAFNSAYEKKQYILFFSLAGAVAVFYILGVKSVFGYVLLSWLVGYLIVENKVFNFFRRFILILLFLMMIFLIEKYYFSYSLVGDFFIRRVFTEPPFQISEYFKYINLSYYGVWDPVFGNTSTIPITHLIGEGYSGNPDTNANTNTFLVMLAGKGVFGFILSIVLVAGLLFILDSMYKANRKPALLYIGFIFGILIIEQAVTTTLLSSGIALLTIFVMLSKTTNGKSLISGVR